MRCFTAYTLLLLLLACGSCTTRRDNELRKLYSDATEYIRETRVQLEAAKNPDAAAAAILNSLPKLEKLVERKKKLEKEYPEIRTLSTREKLHSKFEEFRTMRSEFKSFFAYGQTLLDKYKNHPGFISAIRRGWDLVAWF